MKDDQIRGPRTGPHPRESAVEDVGAKFPETPIQAVLHELSIAVKTVEGDVAELADRLRPVLVADEDRPFPESEVEDSLDGTEAPLLNEIRLLTERLRSINTRLVDMTARLVA